MISDGSGRMFVNMSPQLRNEDTINHLDNETGTTLKAFNLSGSNY